MINRSQNIVFRISFTANQGTALKSSSTLLMCAQNLAHTLLSLSYCKLFVAWFALYSPLGQTSIPRHLPSHWILRPFRVYAQPTKHLFLDCTKEDGGISSCPRNVLKAPFFVKYHLVQKRIFICSS